MNKFITDIGGKVLGVLLVFVIFIGFATALPGFTEDIDERNRLKNTCVTVEAKITGMEETEDSEGDTEYRMYISYTYDGKEYSDVYYGKYSTTKNYGKNVSVEIDPDEPTKLRPSSASFSLILFGLFFLVITFIFTMLFSSILGTLAVTLIRKNIYENRYLNENIVKNDVQAENRWRRIFAMGIYGAIFVFLAVKSFISYQNSGSVTLAITYGIIMLVSVTLSYLYLRVIRDSCENIYIVKSRLDEIAKETDSDGNPYTVWYFSGFDKWNGDKKCYVSLCGQTIKDLRQGDAVYIAYSGDKTIERIYNSSEFSM